MRRAPGPLTWLITFLFIVYIADSVGGWVNLLLICVLMGLISVTFIALVRPPTKSNRFTKANQTSAPMSGERTIPRKDTKMKQPSTAEPISARVDPERFSALVTNKLFPRSGSVFYSGRGAFSRPSRVYVLGLNPGGSPLRQARETVERDLSDWRELPELWSAYLDESWEGRAPGTSGLQPRMLHMFKQLKLDPRLVPASNVVFARSGTEAQLAAEKSELLRLCWPVHDAIIKSLGIDTVLCLGGTAGRWTRDALGAHELYDEYQEQNGRGWRSQAHLNSGGKCVVTLTHPGRADWRNPQADPSGLIRRALDR